MFICIYMYTYIYVYIYINIYIYRGDTRNISKKEENARCLQFAWVYLYFLNPKGPLRLPSARKMFQSPLFFMENLGFLVNR